MDSAQLVELALKYLKCPQKELADRLQVSPTQITKWKNDEHMSADMERKIRDMIGVGDRNPRVVTLAGSIEAADKWEALVDFLAESAAENAETGYDTYPLTDEHQDIPGLLLSKTFDTLENMGIRIRSPFPLNWTLTTAGKHRRSLRSPRLTKMISRLRRLRRPGTFFIWIPMQT